MSDTSIPIGQNIPLADRATLNRITNSSMPQADDLSFHNVLNRQQMTAAQLNQIQPPTFNQSKNTFQSQTIENKTTMNPSFSQTANQVSSNQMTDAELLKFFSHMPEEIPQGEDFEKKMLENYLAYQQSKTQREQAQGSPDAAHFQNQPPQPEAEPFAPAPIEFKDPAAAQIFQAKRQQMQAEQMYNAFASPTHPSATPQNQENLTPIQQAEAIFPKIPIEQEMGGVKIARASHPVEESPKQPQKTTAEPTANSPDNQETPTQAVGSFFKDMLSGLSLGFYRPNGEAAPSGFSRVIYPLQKLVYEMPKDLVYDLPASMVNKSASEGDQEAPRTRRMSRSSKPWLPHRA